jgi:basic membrane protein A
MMQDALTNVSAQNPNSKFLFIDGVVDNPNVLSVTFKENEGSYLMGIIAAKMSKTGKIGFIGGVDAELIQRFESGFVAGVESINPDAGKLLADRTLVKYAGNFDDSQKGKELANSLIDAGCDVIYHAAGGVGIGMFDAVQAARSSGKDVWAIGVDMDQAVTLPQYASFILSSCMKRVDTATYDAAKDLVNGTLVTGQHKELGLKEDGVGIAPTTSNNVPQDVLDLVTKYQDAIISGQIVVPATLDDLKNFTVPTI